MPTPSREYLSWGNQYCHTSTVPLYNITKLLNQLKVASTTHLPSRAILRNKEKHSLKELLIIEVYT